MAALHALTQHRPLRRKHELKKVQTLTHREAGGGVPEEGVRVQGCGCGSEAKPRVGGGAAVRVPRPGEWASRIKCNSDEKGVSSESVIAVMSPVSRLQVCVEIRSKTRLCVWARGGRAETAERNASLVDPAGGEPEPPHQNCVHNFRKTDSLYV